MGGLTGSSIEDFPYAKIGVEKCLGVKLVVMYGPFALFHGRIPIYYRVRSCLLSAICYIVGL